jgi:hemerythrin-like metal-binding protein
MHRFETSADLETGNTNLDDQVQTLFTMANEILFSTELAQSHEQFRRAVTYLVSYLEYHLAAEELAMLERGFSSRRFHTAFHDHVRREARTIAASLLRKGTIEEARSALFFILEDWIEYHLRTTDRQLASFLSEQASTNGSSELPGIRPLTASGKISADFDEQILARVAGLA